MTSQELKSEIERDIENIIPKFNKQRCKDGCNCIEIAEFKNNGDPIKNYPCLGQYDCFTMTAKEFLKEHRIYEDDIIYNSIGEIVGTMTQLMEEYTNIKSQKELVHDQLKSFILKVSRGFDDSEKYSIVEDAKRLFELL